MDPPPVGVSGYKGTSNDDLNNSDKNKTLNEKMESAVQEKKIFNIYSDKYSLNSIFVMIESTSNENFGRIHPLKVGHILHKKLLVKNIIEVKSVGKNRVRVQLKSLKDANDLIKNSALGLEQLHAFIPSHVLETKGIIRGIDTFFDDNYILQNIKSSSRVVHINRFTRKIVKEGQVEPVIIKKQTVLVTFEGNILPAEVTIDSVVFPVEAFYGKVTQCYKCLNFGHISKQCRSAKNLCVSCGKSKDEEVEHTCTALNIFCIHCKVGTHRSNAKNCPHFVKQKDIKKIMVDSKITFKEAENQYNKSYAGVTVSNRFSIFDSNNYNSNFPSLENQRRQTLSQQNPQLRLRNRQSSFLSQPTASTSTNQINEQNKKKRKTLSPVDNAMFPFVFGPSSPLPPYINTENNTLMGKQEQIINSFAEFVVQLVSKISSLEDIKNLQIDKIKKDLSDILNLSVLSSNIK